MYYILELKQQYILAASIDAFRADLLLQDLSVNGVCTAPGSSTEEQTVYAKYEENTIIPK